MTRDEWIRRVKYGTDIIFNVQGKCFTIFNWDQFIITEAYAEEDKRYDTAEELVDQFMVNGKSLGELAGEIVIEDYTLAGDYEDLL